MHLYTYNMLEEIKRIIKEDKFDFIDKDQTKSVKELSNYLENASLLDRTKAIYYVLSTDIYNDSYRTLLREYSPILRLIKEINHPTNRLESDSLIQDIYNSTIEFQNK